MAEPDTRLSSQEVAERLSQLAGWRIEDGKLSKAYRFADFMGAVDFVNKVAGLAESEGHHPDLAVSWGRVVVSLTTHSAAGLTARDFRLAALIDQP